MLSAGKFLATAAMVLGIPPALSSQATLVKPADKTGLATAAPRVLESVAFDPSTRQANLGAVPARRDLIAVNFRWNQTDPSVNDRTTIAMSSSSWIPGSYSLRLELGFLPGPARLTRYWYVGTTRQESSCALAAGSAAACELSFTVQSASEAFGLRLAPWIRAKASMPPSAE